jgi:hypothetical protein
MWSIVQGPHTEPLPDAVAYLWTIERDEDGEQRTVRVEVTGTALASVGLPSPLPEVIESKGATAVLGFAEWREPPEVVAVSTMAIRPMPGSHDPASDTESA